MRRAEQGHYHHIAGPYLLRYAQEASWREDHRRISNGTGSHGCRAGDERGLAWTSAAQITPGFCELRLFLFP